MAVLSRYLIAQIARPMIATVLVALLVLLAERMLRVVDLVIGWRGSLLVVFEMLGFLVPHYMSLAVPVAFFIGILLTLGRFSREGELDAMMAAGSGLPQLIRPLFGFSLCLLLFNLALVSHAQPFSRYAYRAAVQAVTNASFQQLLRPNVFTTLGQTTSMVERISDDKRHFGGVFIYSKGDDGDQVTITAEAGTLERKALTDPVAIDLANGVHQVVPAPTKGKEERPDAVVARFRQFETVIADTRPNDLKPRGEDEREMTIPELAGYLGQPPPHVRPEEIESELSGRLVRTFSIPLLPFLAVPLSLGRRRSQGSYGLAIGIAILVCYNQLVGFGETLADDGQIGSFLGLWVPYLLFAALCLGLFWRTARRVPRSSGASRIERLIEIVVRRVSERIGSGRAGAT